MAIRACPTIEKVQEMIDGHFAAVTLRGTAVFVNSKIVDITFTTPFSLVPIVVATKTGSAGNDFFVSIKTVGGFRIEFVNNTTVDVDWLAVER